MDIAKYEELAGITVETADVDKVSAMILKTQSILETMLGFTLVDADRDDNQYVEIGKTALECPFSYDVDSLLAPDVIVYAYRVFSLDKRAKYLTIDPATEIHAFKLVKNGVTLKTLDLDDYTFHYKDGLIKYIELCDCVCECMEFCSCTQLAVDATWAFSEIPSDLNYIWVDMVTYYSDEKKDLRSETLATHSYTKFDKNEPQYFEQNLAILRKYAGPNGSLIRVVAK